MIEALEIENFKCHRNTRLEFGRITVLVGPNGSGKTSVLAAMDSISSMMDHKITKVEEVLVKYGCSRVRIDLVMSTDGGRMRVTHDSEKKGFVVDTAPSSQGRTINTTSGNHHISGVVKLWSKKIAEPSYLTTTEPILSPDGYGLASLISHFMAYRPDLFQEIEREFSELIPTVRRIRVRPAKIQVTQKRIIKFDDQKIPIHEDIDVIGHELVFDTISGKATPAHAMSEGTLVALAILSVIHSPNRPNMILLDDIQQGLHPMAQRDLMRLLKKLTESRDDLQIVMTTHSPYIVDELEAKDVWVFNLNERGESVCRRLSDHPDAEKALRVLTTGEFLGEEGEDWVLEASTDEASS